MNTIGRVNKPAKRTNDYSIRRAIAEFQGMFEKECQTQSLDDAVSSLADRNEIVHVYENYRGNMERVLENVQNYRTEYQRIGRILWDYCKQKKILMR